MEYRKLTSSEIGQLKNNGCSAKNWEKVYVSEIFTSDKINNVNFDGEVFIGNHVTINNVSHLSNYRIDEDVVLENIFSLSVEGETTFANGAKISVLNEGGGRELMIYDELAAQIGYLMVTSRHNLDLIEKLELMIQKYATSRKSSVGKIGKSTSIRNCGVIKNIWIDESANIIGANSLIEGTIRSSWLDPIFVGDNVIAKHFIIQSGSSVTDGALIDNCFIGQGVRIGKQYSAENCAFFSNCEGFHGEAVSVFAGPYTVTHHKSTLLIAAMFSFYNAGSGTNQSNHMYKLGPLHQGILERGAKTGSFSYMLWPSRVGAFSVVIGKHYTNFDSSELPFSYINEDNGKSILTPAMNMFTVGTRRDSQKWLTRDRRKDDQKFDILKLNLFNPYIVGKILEGSEIITQLIEKANKENEFVTYKGLQIKRLLLKTSLKYYEMAVKIFIGQEVFRKLSVETSTDFNKLISMLHSDSSLYREKWLDIAGMLISKKDYESIIFSVTGNKINNLSELYESFRNIDKNYANASWAWCSRLIEKRLNTNIEAITKEQLSQIIIDWRDSSLKLNNMILKDAEKEFDQTSKIGFGMDGDNEVRDKDFETVRGRYAENKFVSELLRENEQIVSEANRILQILSIQ